MAGVLALLTVGTITAASAYWSGPGAGSGSARTGTTQAVTLTPGTAAAQLYPGGLTAVSLTVTNPNPNPGSVRIVSLALDTSQGSAGFGVDGAHSGCSTSSLSFTTQTNGGAGWSLPAGGAVSVNLPASLSMSTSADNACQGASFTVYLKAVP